LQDEITSRIAVALDLELIGAEAARSTEHPDALDYILLGRAAVSKPPSRDGYAEAIGLYERALALDPHSVEAQSRLAILLTSRVLDNMSESAAIDMERAERLTVLAAAASPRNPLAHFAKGQVLRVRGQPGDAIPEYEAALASNRNWVNVYSALGYCKLYTGSTDGVIPLVEQTIRLSPRDPHVGSWYFRIGQAHVMQSRTDEAIAGWKRRAALIRDIRNFMPTSPPHMPSKARPSALRSNSSKPAS
jgi:adenylate cyclase